MTRWDIPLPLVMKSIHILLLGNNLIISPFFCLRKKASSQKPVDPSASTYLEDTIPSKPPFGPTTIYIKEPPPPSSQHANQPPSTLPSQYPPA